MKSELLRLLDELPEIYKSIAAAISNLKNATHYYETFVSFLVPRFVLYMYFIFFQRLLSSILYTLSLEAGFSFSGYSVSSH